jgi:hypothetical protein
MHIQALADCLSVQTASLVGRKAWNIVIGITGDLKLITTVLHVCCKGYLYDGFL